MGPVRECADKEFVSYIGLHRDLGSCYEPKHRDDDPSSGCLEREAWHEQRGCAMYLDA